VFQFLSASYTGKHRARNVINSECSRGKGGSSPCRRRLPKFQHDVRFATGVVAIRTLVNGNGRATVQRQASSKETEE
jgi:hypothetical protein